VQDERASELDQLRMGVVALKQKLHDEQQKKAMEKENAAKVVPSANSNCFTQTNCHFSCKYNFKPNASRLAICTIRW
jgi:hypothetical protein